MLDEKTAQDIEQFDVQAVNKKENRSLYEARTKIHPKRVSGVYRKLKWGIMIFTLGIYYLTPWLRWDRGETLPDQAVLIDFPARRFYFFFIEIWPQEFFFVTGLLVMAGIGLFFTTSLAGRMWCGYSCPQTVWTDLFIYVERFIEGDRNARIKLDGESWSGGKIIKKIIKHGVWILIAMLTGGAWIFYYADAPTLAVQFVQFQAPAVAYITVAILTGTTYLLGGIAREQVCIYMCPWPRVMGAMMDEESLTVTYRDTRGEPRGSHKKGDSWEGKGDCVDCNACVAVCPMGIDIRDGSQLECTTCALCIDACNDVMDKVGRPRNLIGYAAVANKFRVERGEKIKVRWFRPRTVTYFALFCFVGAIIVYGLSTRGNLDVNVLRDRNPLFVTLSDGSIRNGYTFKVLNKAHDQRTFNISLSGLEGLSSKIIGDKDQGSGGDPLVTVSPDRLKSLRILVTAPKSSLTATSHSIAFTIRDVKTREKAQYVSVFRGPEK